MMCNKNLVDHIDQTIYFSPETLMLGITEPSYINVEVWEIGGYYYSIKSICDLSRDNWRMVDVLAYHGKKPL